LPIEADPGAAAEARAQDIASGSGRFGSQTVPPYQVETSEDDDEPGHWITIKLQDEQGNPVPGERWTIITPDGRQATGSLNSQGESTLQLDEAGTCEICFNNLDEAAWDWAS